MRAPQTMAAPVAVSVLVPVILDRTDMAQTHQAYSAAIGAIDAACELVYLLGPKARRALADLRRLKIKDERLRIVQIGRSSDETMAIACGLAHARGEIMVTLPPEPQVDLADIPRVVAALDGCDFVAARPRPQADPPSHRRHHWLRRASSPPAADDLPCQVHACRRAVLREIVGCGAPARTMPMVARERGFATCEVGVRPGRAAPKAGVAELGWRDRLRDRFDVLSLYVVLKLTRQPLRFFAAIGLPLFVIGSLFTLWLVIERLVLGMPLAGRPALILGVLMVVLGIQVVALGLIGELILFVAGKKLRNGTATRVI